MTYEQLLERLDPQVYQSLKQSLQLGKWPDGRPLSDEQKEICMEAIIWYEQKHNVPPEERVGYINRGTGCSSDDGDDAGDPVRILN